MLVEIIMTPFWVLIEGLVSLLPSMSVVSNGFNTVLDVVGYGCAFIGSDFFLGLLGNIVFWLVAQLSWSIIEWCYIKIPGVN